MSKDTLNFRTSSGIKSIVGRDLITDKFVAIFELVKNSYDANAKNVIVSFNNLEHQNKEDLLDQDQTASLYELGEYEPHLIIRDDGKGMSKDDLQNKWLFLAYSEKKDKEGANNNGRSFVGSKGVGRFSCDTLGKKLILKTKKSNEKIEHQLFINWEKFEEDQFIDFNDITIEYRSIPINNTSSYTELIIRNLRSTEWHLVEEQRQTRNALEKLKNPFKHDDGFNIYTGLDISKNKFLQEENKVFNNVSEIIKNRTTTIEACIGKNIELEIFDRGELILQLQQSNNTILKHTPTAISIHYLNPVAKNIFKRRMGVRAVNYGTVFIYKNGFRVMPYGDDSIDLFGLNLRKTQGHSRYVATRELLGYFEIKDPNNNFKETSSRNNGFIQNSYFNSLEELYMDKVHRILEYYIRLIQWGENSETKEEVFFDPNHSEIDNFKNYLTKYCGYNITFFKESISQLVEQQNSEKQLQKIISTTTDIETKKIAKQATKRIKSLKKETAHQSQLIQDKEQNEKKLERQVENLQLKRRNESTFGEQITHHFVGMGEKLRFATNKIMPLIKQMDINIQQLAFQELNKIRSVQQELFIFKDLLLKTSIDMRSDQLINWHHQTEWFIKEKLSMSKKIKLTCNNYTKTQKNWDIVSNAIGLQMMLENFYQNSKEHKASYIDIEFYDNKLVIKNNSNPISKQDISKITELGYSIKENGTGIGLYQIKEFVEKYNFKLQIMSNETSVIFEISRKDK